MLSGRCRRPNRTARSTGERGASRDGAALLPDGGRILNVTSPEVLESPSTSHTDDNDDLFHYVPKNRIAESAVMGTPVEALCGAVFPVTKAPKPGSPVCPACQEIYDSMPG